LRLLRYFNFISRGFTPNEADFRHNVVLESAKLFEQSEAKATASNFFQSKVFIVDAKTALSKEAAFRTAVLTEFVKSGHMSRNDAFAWYMKHFAPLYKPLLLADMESHLLASFEKEAEGMYDFKRPW